MDETKNTLPPWLPWATTACLAALVACLGELWILEKARLRLMRDEILMTEASLKSAENQLEAERIVGRRELNLAQARTGEPVSFSVALLSPLSGPGSAGSPWGVVVFESGGRRGILKFSGLPDLGAGGDYQLWLEGTAEGAVSACATFGASREESAEGIALGLPSSVVPGSRFLLIKGKKGGGRTLEEAIASGSIVLATLPYSGKIPNR